MGSEAGKYRVEEKMEETLETFLLPLADVLGGVTSFENW